MNDHLGNESSDESIEPQSGRIPYGFRRVIYN
jgi:hypothetical protein